jgi:2-methylisocitrate lyase-like PEP mutase family enzyme
MSSELRRQLRHEPWPLPGISGATPHHAQLAEATGFRLFFMSGSQAAAHIMGMPGRRAHVARRGGRERPAHLPVGDHPG